MTEWEETLLEVWRAGQRLSAVGPGPVDVHLEHSRALGDQLPTPARAVDLGSGAGIPGLALAGCWPDSQWLLVDAALRRVRLLEQAVAKLGWGARVTIVHGRAEDLARGAPWRGWADLVTARSFGPPATAAECGVGFLRAGGLLVVSEPPEADATRWPNGPLGELGLTPVPASPGERIRIQRLERTGPVPDHVPRRTGVPAKRPLF